MYLILDDLPIARLIDYIPLKTVGGAFKFGYETL